MFRDRRDAGRRLAAALEGYRGQDVVVLALPRGGVPVAAEVADVLGAPLDLVLARKIGSPFQAELAMGAVAEGGSTVRNPDVIAMFGVDEATFLAARAAELVEIDRRRAAYLGSRQPVDLTGRVAILVDDGVATGATTRAALQAVRSRGPRRLVLATPVAPRDVVTILEADADEVICLEPLGSVGAIGAHYLDFRQLEDNEVVHALAHARSRKPD
jgi:putative phosphoribosyl transferase